MNKNPHIGSSLDDFLEEYDIVESSKKTATFVIFESFFKNPSIVYKDNNNGYILDILIETIKSNREELLPAYTDFRKQYIKNNYGDDELIATLSSYDIEKEIIISFISKIK